ncbi:MAG TPA: ATP-binding protein [Gemmatimonadaceae bacterium]|nr:ATP-binding protein [Gemmatimonadaceae bacterium]
MTSRPDIHLEYPPAEDQLEYDEVAPNASAMIESMRAYGYTLPAAIADLIDNSIAAGCSTVWLRFNWSGADSWVTVTDDGEGMTERELRDAMRLGSRNPRMEREPKDLGRFGLGLKTASLSQCRRLTVASRTAPGQESVRRWDLDYLSRREIHGWHLLRSPYRGSEERAAVPSDLESGTVVLWEVLDRVVGDAGKDDRKLHQHFLSLVGDVEAHLAMVFHRFIGRSRGRLRILINEKEVVAWDPFLESHPATQSTPEEIIDLPGHSHPIRLKGFVLPHKDRLGEIEHQKASGPAGWNAQQGFYLYRNDRLIVPGSWLGLGSPRPWTKEEHYKLARIRLDIPNSMDHEWHLDVKKSSAQPPPLIRDRLTALAQTIRLDARAVYAHRGQYRQRTTREELRRPWKVARHAGAVSYRIDRAHPVIGALIGSLPRELRADIEAMLKILEETVPVEQIWLDSAENSDGFARPFRGMTASQRRHLIELSYAAIRRNRGIGHSEAISLLLSCEEFADEESRSILETLPSTDAQ